MTDLPPGMSLEEEVLPVQNQAFAQPANTVKVYLPKQKEFTVCIAIVFRSFSPSLRPSPTLLPNRA
jgi:hypothetical protein